MVLSGSLPPGVPDNWYAQLVAQLRDAGSRVAVDTSDAPLTALAAEFSSAAPDLIKPNAEELASLATADPQHLEEAAANGDPAPVINAARRLVDRGVGAVLATLGAAGAGRVDDTGSWVASPLPITPRSTVGAGDSSLAGYLRADCAGDPVPQRLALAVAYGSAAAALPGSALPAPHQVEVSSVHVRPT